MASEMHKKAALKESLRRAFISLLLILNADTRESKSNIKAKEILVYTMFCKEKTSIVPPDISLIFPFKI